MAEIQLGRDVLDKQVVDREGRRMGRVDGLLLMPRADGPPQIAWLEVGPSALLRRISPRLAARVETWTRELGVSSGEPLRIAPAQVLRFGREIEVDLDASRSKAYAWERWLRKRFIDRIPGSGA